MHEHLLASASRLSDEALLARVKTLAGQERSSTVELVAHLAELEIRKVCLGNGRSLFLYCTEVLHLSEHAAYNRIGTGRAARRFPLILDLLAAGSVNVTTVTLLAPHLTEENHRSLLREATHKTKDEVKEIVRRLDPRPDAKTVIRRVSVPPTQAATAAAAPPPQVTASRPPAEPAPPLVMPAPAPRPAVEPLAPERYRLQITMDKDTHDTLRRLQDLLARETGGDAAAIVKRALHDLLKDVEKKKLGFTSKPRRSRPPRAGSRHVPAAVRRVVWRRDKGRCAYVGREGRCAETRYLEWHHVVPHGYQGPATVDNISLRCRAHNLYEGEQVFGKFDPMVSREAGPAYGASELGLDRVRKVTLAWVSGGARYSPPRSCRGISSRSGSTNRARASSENRISAE